MALEIQINGVNEGVQQVVLNGEADIYEAQNLRDSLQQVFAAKAKEVVVDCSRLSYVDSTCLGVFIGLLKRQREHGGSVKLLSLQPHVHKIFMITGLDKVFELAG